MIDGLQTNNMMKAVAAGIEVVEHYDGCFSDDNAEKNVGLRLTLANLLVSVRRAPGDFALSARLNRKSLTMLPPSMDNQRFRINSDLSATLSSLAQEGGALEPGAAGDACGGAAANCCRAEQCEQRRNPEPGHGSGRRGAASSIQGASGNDLFGEMKVNKQLATSTTAVLYTTAVYCIL